MPDPQSARPSMMDVDFAQRPFIVIWEATRACRLACLHCRADAQTRRDPGELSTAEAMRLMDDIAGLGRPLFVITGGDPLERPDIAGLVAYGTSRGLRVALTPSATPLATPEALRALRDAGLARLAVSLDGSTPEIHDRFRGVAGSWTQTLAIIESARALGLPVQVNTTVSRYNVDDLEDLIALMGRLGIVLWSVFFVVPVGRARPEDIATPDEFERIFHRLYDLSRTAPFDIKTTEAPHYRRVVLQRQVEARRAAPGVAGPDRLGAFPGLGPGDGVGRAKGVGDGNGFVFVSHRGEIFPSGFLPVAAGNVRTDDLATVYREHAVFRALRDPDMYRGKCGVCEYRNVCGGSRARAWAMTGDYLESDPFCSYVPWAWRRLVAAGAAEPPDDYFARRIPGWTGRFGAGVPAMHHAGGAR